MHQSTSLYLPSFAQGAVHHLTCPCGWQEEVRVGEDTYEARRIALEAVIKLQKDHELGLAL